MVRADGHDGRAPASLSEMEVRVTGRQASATMLIPLKAIQKNRRLCDDRRSVIRQTLPLGSWRLRIAARVVACSEPHAVATCARGGGLRRDRLDGGRRRKLRTRVRNFMFAVTRKHLL
jgi:hypothetical protein